MPKKISILALNGSASKNSSNLTILHAIAEMGQGVFDLELFDDLSELPHFHTELTNENTPARIIELRNRINMADGMLICTPEYVFSIPSRLKNALEWCVSTTVFSGKPLGIITASASDSKGHEELKLIMATVDAQFTDETTLLIQGIKGKVNASGQITDSGTKTDLEKFIQA